VTYDSSNRPGISNGRRTHSYRSRKHTEAVIRIRRDFMGMEPEEAGNIYFPPALLLALKTSPRSAFHWERWKALRQLVLAHETLGMATWSEAIPHLALQVGVDDPAPDHQLEISRAWERLRGHAWVTRQSSWHRGGKPRPGPEARGLLILVLDNLINPLRFRWLKKVVCLFVTGKL
jgi:hypothetical protein